MDLSLLLFPVLLQAPTPKSFVLPFISPPADHAHMEVTFYVSVWSLLSPFFLYAPYTDEIHNEKYRHEKHTLSMSFIILRLCTSTYILPPSLHPLFLNPVHFSSSCCCI